MTSSRLRGDARPRWGATASDPPAVPSGRIVLLAAAALTGVWCRSALFRVAHRPPGPVDRGWDAAMTAARTPTALRVAESLAVVGTGTPATALVVVAGTLIGATRGWSWGASVGAVSIVSVLQVAGLEALARRSRPDPAYGAHNAFPSGHTTFASLLGSVVILFARRTGVRGVALGWIGAMAWSRTYLRAHWLTDVLAAILIGSSEPVLLVAAVHRLGRTGARARTAPADAPSAPRPDLRRG